MSQKGMKKPHRAPLQREIHRTRIAELILKGEPVRQIGQQLGLSPSTIRRDLAALKIEWERHRIQTRDEWTARQLQGLELLIKEAWRAWGQSLAPVTKRTTRSKGATKKPERGARLNVKPEDVLSFEQTHREETRGGGDPRHLEIIERALAARAKLLGLNQPTKIAPTDPTGERPYSDVRAELLRRLDDIAVNVAVPLPAGVGQSGDHTGQARFQRVLPPGSPAAVEVAEKQDNTGESGAVEAEVLPPDFEITR